MTEGGAMNNRFDRLSKEIKENRNFQQEDEGRSDRASTRGSSGTCISMTATCIQQERCPHDIAPLRLLSCYSDILRMKKVKSIKVRRVMEKINPERKMMMRKKSYNSNQKAKNKKKRVIVVMRPHEEDAQGKITEEEIELTIGKCSLGDLASVPHEVLVHIFLFLPLCDITNNVMATSLSIQQHLFAMGTSMDFWESVLLCHCASEMVEFQHRLQFHEQQQSRRQIARHAANRRGVKTGLPFPKVLALQILQHQPSMGKRAKKSWSQFQLEKTPTLSVMNLHQLLAEVGCCCAYQFFCQYRRLLDKTLPPPTKKPRSDSSVGSPSTVINKIPQVPPFIEFCFDFVHLVVSSPLFFMLFFARKYLPIVPDAWEDIFWFKLFIFGLALRNLLSWIFRQDFWAY